MTQCVLGVDPGLGQLGWGVVSSDTHRHRHVDHGIITTEASSSLEQRLLHLHREMTAIIQAYKPKGMGVEMLFFTKNISSAIPVAHARGVVLLAGAEAGLLVEEYSPMTIKQSIVGSGSADKVQIQNMVRILLGMPKDPQPDHAADALAAAITFVHHGSLWSTAFAAS